MSQSSSADSWLVLVTNSQRTGRIVRLLEAENIPHFAPKTLSDLGRIVWLFPSYVFALLDLQVRQVQYFWGLRGVRRVARLARPDVVQLNLLRSRAIVGPSGPILLPGAKQARFQRGEQLYIRSGPFMGHRCIFDEQVSSTRCSVSIEVFHREVKVTVEDNELSLFEFD